MHTTLLTANVVYKLQQSSYCDKKELRGELWALRSSVRSCDIVELRLSHTFVFDFNETTTTTTDSDNDKRWWWWRQWQRVNEWEKANAIGFHVNVEYSALLVRSMSRQWALSSHLIYSDYIVRLRAEKRYSTAIKESAGKAEGGLRAREGIFFPLKVLLINL